MVPRGLRFHQQHDFPENLRHVPGGTGARGAFMPGGTAMTPPDEHRSSVRRGLDALYLGAGYLAAFFLVVIFLLMMGLAIGRPLGFNIPSGDDFTAWSLVAMAFLGLAHTFKRGEMIRVGLLLERLGGETRRKAELATLVVALAAIAYFAWQFGVLAHDSWRFNDISQGVVSVPLWIPQSTGVLGLVILVIALIDEIIHIARGNAPSYDRAPPASPDEFVDRVASGGGV